VRVTARTSPSRHGKARSRCTHAGKRSDATGSAPEALFSARLDAAASEIEGLLDRLLSATAARDEIARPRRLLEAMRYATLGGGKRLRPLLAIEAGALFDVPRQRALMVGAALECVHCYSLVHDDLPAMDDDAMRRGRPTVHRAFDAATAILVGDSLLTLAFDLLSRSQTHPDPAVRIALVAGLAHAAGLGGMAGGQMLDLAAEGRYGTTTLREAEVVTLDRMKTGALIRFACLAGAILGQAPKAARESLGRYGQALGQAFQIADDLLDIEGDAATLGKSTGKDAAHGKATLVRLLGRDGAHARLAALVAQAERALDPFGADAATLRAAARFVAARRA
jgi:farnesyl diphosphate synthase